MHVMIYIMILFASFENGLCLVLGELKEKANCQSITLKLYRARIRMMALKTFPPLGPNPDIIQQVKARERVQ